MRELAPATVLLILLGACGADGGRPEINATAATACAEVAEVACYNLYRCCAEGEIEAFLGVSAPRTEAECRQDIERRCARDIAPLDWSIDEGRAGFDAATLDACLEALIAPDDACAVIDSMLPWAEACVDSAWTGSVAVGGDCYADYECGGLDTFCTASRVCAELPEDGDPCAALGCATGFFCDGGTCEPERDDGDACTSNDQCSDGLFCALGDATPRCTARRAAGASCDGNLACESGQCLPGTCLATSQACFTDADCFGRCADDNAACGDDGDCAPGTCSMSNAACSDLQACTGGVADVCQYPVVCNPPSCEGDPTCAVRFFTIDYCEDALADLPLP